MHISTALFDNILNDLDPEEEPLLYNLTQALRGAVSDISTAALDLDARVEALEKRLN